jgi:predicted transcriptional regulator
MKKLTLKLDDETHRKLVEWAKRENRSLHGQLLKIVQDAVQAEVQAEKYETAPVGL